MKPGFPKLFRAEGFWDMTVFEKMAAQCPNTDRHTLNI
jgi:hypothetical protein